jgi:selenocysteine lyase/cysteine desulfurase
MIMNFDPTPYRRWFPITDNLIYLNHAGTGPLSRRARQEIEDCLDTYAVSAEFPLEQYFDRVAKSRAIVAQFLKVDPEEITFTHNTSQGLFIALMNIIIEPGDTVIVMDEVFPAARYAVVNNLPGVTTRFVRFTGQDPLQVIQEHLDPTVKAVVVDLVQYLSGERIDIKRLSSYLREKGVTCIVDGIQAVGAIDFSVRETDVDFLSCGAAKWLFGPSGAGFLYVNKRGFPHMRKLATGWLGAKWTGFEHCENPPPMYDDARMFEQGTRNIIGISALAENCRMLMEVGMDNVERHIRSLKQRLWAVFRNLAYEILTPEAKLQSGIITVRPRGDAVVVFRRLMQHNVVLSFRSGWLRFSPHFYNTKEEIDTVASLL